MQSNWNFCCLFNTLLVLILITTNILNVSSTRKKGSLYKASLSLEWVSQCDIFHNTNLFEARDACKGFLKTSWIIDRHLMYSTSVESISWATCALFSPTDVPVLASDWSAFGKGTLNQIFLNWEKVESNIRALKSLVKMILSPNSKIREGSRIC